MLYLQDGKARRYQVSESLPVLVAKGLFVNGGTKHHVIARQQARNLCWLIHGCVTRQAWVVLGDLLQAQHIKVAKRPGTVNNARCAHDGI
jgi:hypothetical protein